MKTLFLLSLAVLSQSCGKGLQDPAKIVKATPAAIATGATLILDAKDISGTCPSASVNWPDSSGNGHNGTLNCNTGGSINTSPASVTFDGTSTLVTTNLIADDVALPSTTWVAWIKPNNSVNPTGHVMSIDNLNGDFDRSLLITDTGRLRAFVGGGGPAWDATAADIAQWQFVALEYSATEVAITKNGTRLTHAAPGFQAATAVDLTIGASGVRNDGFMSGEIGWVAVYPRVLTADEIKKTCLAHASRYGGTCP